MQEQLTIAYIYRYLALALRYPQDSLMDDTFWQFFKQLVANLEQIKWDLVSKKWIFQSEHSRIEELQVEHTRLFINAVPHVIAPPYGSVYMSAHGTVYGKSTVETLNYYRKKGFQLLDEKEPADYLGYELEFMAQLETKDNEALEEFLKVYFRPWFILFHDRVLAEARHPYFSVMVKLIDFFTGKDSGKNQILFSPL